MARKWFTAETTAGLDAQALSVLNRAARHFQNARPHKPLTHLELVIFRTAYRSGMSAADLLEAAYDE